MRRMPLRLFVIAGDYRWAREAETDSIQGPVGVVAGGKETKSFLLKLVADRWRVGKYKTDDFLFDADQFLFQVATFVQYV